MTQPPSRARLLIVEDEADLIEALRAQMESHGYQVLTALDGITALELAKREKPDLILLDLLLPGLDGYRVLQLLKADERCRHIPVLVITARADPKDWTLAMECGADGCLAKPLRSATLLEWIRTTLSRDPETPRGNP